MFNSAKAAMGFARVVHYLFNEDNPIEGILG